jgi:hypothetical protein
MYVLFQYCNMASGLIKLIYSLHDSIFDVSKSFLFHVTSVPHIFQLATKLKCLENNIEKEMQKLEARISMKSYGNHS